MIDRLKVFQTELKEIQTENIRKYAELAIQNVLPEYFFYVPASSTGKYHPEYAIGTGGLVRHTKAMAKIAIDVLGLEYLQYTQEEKDLILTGCILHDGRKSGAEEDKSEYTRADHPLLMANALAEAECLRNIIPAEAENFLFDVITSHMGQWNTDYKTKQEILPKPETWAEFFTHLFDYLASRKYLTVIFDDYYLPENYQADESSLIAIIQQIIQTCKEKIQSGVDRDRLYNIIATYNDGLRNPNNIKTQETAETILAAIKETEVNNDGTQDPDHV